MGRIGICVQAGGTTSGQTVNHLAFWQEICARRLRGAPLTGERIDNAATFAVMGNSGDQAAWQRDLERLRAAHRALREAVAVLAERDLDKPLPGEATPLREQLLGLNVHGGYHLGQIVLLRKLQGAWAAAG